MAYLLHNGSASYRKIKSWKANIIGKLEGLKGPKRRNSKAHTQRLILYRPETEWANYDQIEGFRQETGRLNTLS